MRNYLLILFISFGYSTNAQFPYNLEVSSEEYTPIEANYFIQSGWNDPEFTAQLGFVFQFDEVQTSELTQYGSGCVMYSPTWPLSNGMTPVPFDLVDKSTIHEVDSSIISWGTYGDEGERIFIMEWKNCAIVNESPSQLSSINFQIKLYEETGVIEYHYGQIETYSKDQFWCTLGLNFNYSTQEGDFALVSGDIDYPQLTFYNSIQEMYSWQSLNEYPSEGLVFRFIPNDLKTSEFRAHPIKVYPNPTNEILNLELCNVEDWSLYDVNGTAVKRGVCQTCTIETSNLKPGVYTLKIEGYKSNRIIIL